MKSPTTLIKLHERALKILELSEECERRMLSHAKDIQSAKEIAFLPSVEKFHINQFNRCQALRNYLITRYESLITKLN